MQKDLGEKPSVMMVEDIGDEDDLKKPQVKVDYSGVAAKTDPAEIALVKKLDRWIMPMLWSMYWLNYLDRNAIALARLNDLEEDLNLTPTQYLTCVSILFVGYLLGQIPSNKTQLLHGSLFLGVTEAPYNPGAVYLLSIFYNRKEIATRIAILYTGNILATAFAGLIAAGIFHGMDGSAGLAGWQWLFILQGAVTFVIAVVGFFCLPDTPLTTRWLTPEERLLAHSRIAADTVEKKGDTSIWIGLRQAGSDPVVWLFALMAHLHLAANGFKNFFPSVVKTLGFDRTITLVLTCPPYLIAGASTLLVSWSSGRMNERTWHITASKSVAIIGFVVGALVMNTGVKYFAMVVFTIGTYAVNSLILGWVGSTCGQSTEKKAAAISIVTTVMNASFIWTPYLWDPKDAPQYQPAMFSSAAFSAGTAVVAWIVKIIMKRRNERLRQSEDEVQTFYVY
ncbi:major facilitator superfamily transporter [Aureobasidium sp. EXF-12298]|nr:major facilitator superfamily transporter [Aureobasidium sp. EXF-12298]